MGSRFFFSCHLGIPYQIIGYSVRSFAWADVSHDCDAQKLTIVNNMHTHYSCSRKFPPKKIEYSSSNCILRWHGLFRVQAKHHWKVHPNAESSALFVFCLECSSPLPSPTNRESSIIRFDTEIKHHDFKIGKVRETTGLRICQLRVLSDFGNNLKQRRYRHKTDPGTTFRFVSIRTLHFTISN